MTFEALFPKEILEKLPPIYGTENVADQAIVAKLFYPAFHDTGYIYELDPAERLAFGFVDGDFPEGGDIRIDELLPTRDKLGNQIERDLHFEPISLKGWRGQLDR